MAKNSWFQDPLSIDRVNQDLRGLSMVGSVHDRKSTNHNSHNSLHHFLRRSFQAPRTTQVLTAVNPSSGVPFFFYGGTKGVLAPCITKSHLGDTPLEGVENTQRPVMGGISH